MTLVFFEENWLEVPSRQTTRFRGGVVGRAEMGWGGRMERGGERKGEAVGSSEV